MGSLLTATVRVTTRGGPFIQRRKNRERKKKDKSKSEKIILVNKA